MSLKQQIKLVASWNDSVQVGARVRVRKDDGKTVDTFTRSEAQLLGGHTAVVWLDGIPGCFLLTRCTPIP